MQEQEENNEYNKEPIITTGILCPKCLALSHDVKYIAIQKILLKQHITIDGHYGNAEETLGTNNKKTIENKYYCTECEQNLGTDPLKFLVKIDIDNNIIKTFNDYKYWTQKKLDNLNIESVLSSQNNVGFIMESIMLDPRVQKEAWETHKQMSRINPEDMFKPIG